MTKGAARVCSIAVFVATLDGVFKLFAHRYLPMEHAGLRMPIDFALHRNPGITFDIALPLAIVLPLSAIICLVLARTAHHAWNINPGRAASAVIIIVGALDNAVDRLVNHYTTDYIILFGRSAINLADVLIILGTIGFLYYTEQHLPRGAKIS